MKKIIGYVSGIFDLFHIGHLNRIKGAKTICDYLIVGVATDEFAMTMKPKPIIPFSQRIEIISSIKYVDEAVPIKTLNKYQVWQEHKFNILIVGDDNQRETLKEYEHLLIKEAVRIYYHPRTDDVSTSEIFKRIKQGG